LLGPPRHRHCRRPDRRHRLFLVLQLRQRRGGGQGARRAGAERQVLAVLRGPVERRVHPDRDRHPDRGGQDLQESPGPVRQRGGHGSFLMIRRSWLRYALLLTFLAGLAAPAPPQTASRVADLNPGAWESAPPRARDLFVAGGRLFFKDLDSGEPARVDPFGTGSALLADLCPDCPSNPEYLGSLGNTVFFVASPDIGTDVLYRTDGTRAGTFSLGVSVHRPSTLFQA